MKRVKTTLFVACVLTTWLFGDTFALHAKAQQPEPRCFPETGQCIQGRIREYWEQNGGLPVFGFPTTPQREERVENETFQVQWFERNRLELHPENQPPYDVQLGRQGAEQMTQMLVAALPEEQRGSEAGDCRFFPQTSLNVCTRFLRAWQNVGLEFDGRNGTSFEESLALFGLPLSNEIMLTLPDGKAYRVQYFERARFEYHPENQPPYDVLFGLLGNEVRSGTLPPRPSTVLSTPLYFSYENQLYRLERDGLTQTPVSDERTRGELQGFSVSPRGDAVAYVLKGAQGYSLVRTDANGGNRTELIAPGPSMSLPIWSPDGAKIAVHIGEIEVNAQGAVVSVPANGGQQEIIQPDNNTDGPHVAYFPNKWSPDGTRLLLSGAVKQSEGCFRVVKDLASGLLITPPVPNGLHPFCGGVWTPDGTALYASMVDPRGGFFVTSGLWRVGITRPEVQEILPVQTGSLFNMTYQPQLNRNGAIDIFIGHTDVLPQLGDRRPRLFAPYTVQPNGAFKRHLGGIQLPIEQIVGWSPDGSGFLARGPFGDPIGRTKTLWVPLDGGAPREINTAGTAVSWGR